MNQAILFESQECSIATDPAIAVVGTQRKHSKTHRKSHHHPYDAQGRTIANSNNAAVDYIGEIEKNLVESPSPKSVTAFRNAKKSINNKGHGHNTKQGSPHGGESLN